MFCKLKKNGIIGEVYDPTEEKYKSDHVDSLLPHLLDEVTEVEDGVTVGDLLNILSHYKKEINENLISYTGGIQIDPFIEENNKEEGSDPSFKVDHVVFKRHGELTKEEDDDLEPLKEYVERIDVFGIKGGDDTQYGISFSPMNELSNALISLDESYYIHYFNSIYEEKSFDPNWMKIDKRPFSLIDIIGSFLWEITFNGYPDNREERIKEIDKDHKLENNEDPKLEYDGFIIEEMQIDIQERKLEKLIDNEQYEKAEKVRNRIEELKSEVFKKRGENYEIKRPFSDIRKKR